MMLRKTMDAAAAAAKAKLASMRPQHDAAENIAKVSPHSLALAGFNEAAA